MKGIARSEIMDCFPKPSPPPNYCQGAPNPRRSIERWVRQIRILDEPARFA